MTIMELIARHLPGHHGDADTDAEALAHYRRARGQDLTEEERRARALALAEGAPIRHLDRAR